MELAKKQIGLSFVSIIKLTTRMVAGHKSTLPAMRIKLTKAITSLWVNIKPIKPTNSTSRADQEVYRVSQDHQKTAVYLTAW